MSKLLLLFGIVNLGFHPLLAKHPFQYVSIKSGKVKLEGVLVLPQSSSKEIYPAVVMLGGSGGHSITPYKGKAWGPHAYYLEDVFLPRGYAILHLNKRGCGKSEGNWKKNDFYGRARDAWAAVEYLQSLPNIDGRRIGLAGHSQGGWIAGITAAQHPEISFVVSFAGPTVGVALQNDQHMRNDWKCQGFGESQIEKKLKKRHRFLRFAEIIGTILPFIGEARYWKLIHDYEHDDILKQIACPTLLLFGEHDNMVPARDNISYFHQLIPSKVGRNFKIIVLPEGDHFFQISESVCFDGQLSSRFSEKLQGQIGHWLDSISFSDDE